MRRQLPLLYCRPAAQDQKLFAVEAGATQLGDRWVPKTREFSTQDES